MTMGYGPLFVTTKNGSPTVDAKSLITESVALVGDVTVSAGVSIWYGTTLRADREPIVVGEDSNIQESSVLHSSPGLPVRVGARSSLGHGVIVHGATIGNDCLVGMGVIILNGCEVGNECLVAAGSVLRMGTKVPRGSFVAGNPAKVLGPLSDEQFAIVRRTARGYVTRTADYVAAGIF